MGEEQIPGLLSAIREWYRTYKIPDGKPPNKFGLDEQFMDKKYAMEIIEECNHAWEKLVSGEKERTMTDDVGEEVKKLVKNLSRHSLYALAPDVHAFLGKRDFSAFLNKTDKFDGDDTDEDPLSF